ncbi:MAG: mechanosensitive ion channel [Flavobacteriales bacterium]|nr:mechanosensitive ion channel [Flavobacteriales bacterium]
MLSYPIITFSSDFSITILNVILFLLLWILSRLGRKHAKDLVRPFFKKEKIKVGDRELATITLVKQFINILAIVLAIESLSVNNKNVGFTELLEFDLIRIDKFHISIYNILLVAIFVISARILTSTIRIWVLRSVKEERESQNKAHTMIRLLQYFIYTLFIVLAIQSFGIDITILIASSAALFVGLGLGLQKIFADIISGFILLFEGSIKIGDVVEVDKMMAKVIEINIRTSTVRTRDGNYLIIPNSKLTSENLNNWSYNQKSTRYFIQISTKNETDPELIRSLLYQCALQHHLIDKKKPIQVFLEDFGDSSIKFQLSYWTSHAWEVQRIQSDLRFLIDKSLRAEGIHPVASNKKGDEQ